MRPSGTPQELEQRRLRTLHLLSKVFSPVEVARQIGVDPRSVRRGMAATCKLPRRLGVCLGSAATADSA